MKLIKVLQNQSAGSKYAHAYLVFGNVIPEDIQHHFKVNLADFFLVEEKPVKIETIRNLISWMSLKPHSSPWKIAVILDIENMTLQAANSLLKLLEEPPEKSILFLNTFKKEKILPTILSRCQLINQSAEKIEITGDIHPVDKIRSMSIKEKFQYAAKIADLGEVEKIINYYESEFRRFLLAGEDVKEVLARINRYRSLLLSNISVKLLLENLFLIF